jgi:hypothetical protein
VEKEAPGDEYLPTLDSLYVTTMKILGRRYFRLSSTNFCIFRAKGPRMCQFS